MKRDFEKIWRSQLYNGHGMLGNPKKVPRLNSRIASGVSEEELRWFVVT